MKKSNPTPNFRHEHHISRNVTEDTPKAIDEIIAQSLKFSRKLLKETSVERKDILDGAYGRRREAAVRRSLPNIISRYKMTERTSGLYPTAETWARFNLIAHETLESVDSYSSILLGVAIWLLDNISDTHALL